jgi:hypothetical protein
MRRSHMRARRGSSRQTQSEEVAHDRCQLALGDGGTYRRLLREDAVIIVPGHVLDRDATVEAMDASPGWDEVVFEEPRLVELGECAAAIGYRFRGRRGADVVYEAQMTSTWARAKGEWRMVVHQQTPLAS